MRWEFLKITKLFRLTILLFVLLLASNCVNFGSSNIGYIVVAAKFPQSSFKIKAIPAGTVKIVLEITGDGVTTPMDFTLSPETSSLTIPAIKGNKKLSATAFDASGKILAFGTNTLFVYPDLQNKVEIILIEGAIPDNISGSALPSASPSVDINVSATPTQNETVMPSVNPSNPNIDISASPSVSTPPTASPSPTAYSNSNSNSSTYIPAINVNVNIVASTPIPSGISLGMLGP